TNHNCKNENHITFKKNYFARILNALSPWRVDDRDSWKNIGMIAKNESINDELFEEWNNWSKKSKKYKEIIYESRVISECEEKWRSFKRFTHGGYRIDELLKYLKEDNIKVYDFL